MNSITADDFGLEDSLNKCRCCFRALIDEQSFVTITNSICSKFLELTQIQLYDVSCCSNKICLMCSNDLDVFSQFRKDLIVKQNALYANLTKRQPELASKLFSDVKSEVNELFVDCNPDTEDDVFRPQIIIKSEVDDIEALDQDMLDELDASTSWNKPRNIICEICNFKAKNQHHLTSHVLKTHNIDFDYDETTSKEETACPICGSMVRELNRHLKKAHLSDKNYHCDNCSYGSFFKTEMELHMKSHLKKEPQNFYCEFCSREFTKRHLLNRHIKLKHTEKERVHQCSQCDKSFFTISTLKKHVESHGAKNMPCEFCGKLFSCMNNLRTHLYYHADPKFVCEFEGCGKKFFMRKLLRAHMNVHRGQKDFACNYCEKSYFFQSHLKRHIISTHMKLKIDCEVISCSSSFARKETYRNHVIQHHQALGPSAMETLLTKIRTMKVEEFRCVG